MLQDFLRFGSAIVYTRVQINHTHNSLWYMVKLLMIIIINFFEIF